MKKKVKEEEEGEKDDATRQKLGGKQHCEGGCQGEGETKTVRGGLKIT